VLLAIDQGTTGTTCLVFDTDGELAGRAYREFAQHFPRPGWVEHDAAEIWDVTRAVAVDALEDAGAAELLAIGITNQRETVCVWDPQTGEPLHRALVWQDRRTADRCAQLREEGVEDLTRERAGLVLDPYFSATKIEWLLQNVDGLAERARDGRAVFGTIDAWLVFKLTGELGTDATNASRTLLADIRTGARWDPELLASSACPSARCRRSGPRSASSGAPATARCPGGTTCRSRDRRRPAGRAVRSGLPRPRPGQEHVRHRVLRPAQRRRRDAAAARGPADDRRLADRRADVLRARGRRLRHRRRGPVAARRAGDHQGAGETEGLARSVKSTDGVVFVPALTGLGSPHWDPYARGTIVG
jgi:glycerol kinase